MTTNSSEVLAAVSVERYTYNKFQSAAREKWAQPEEYKKAEETWRHAKNILEYEISKFIQNHPIKK